MPFINQSVLVSILNTSRVLIISLPHQAPSQTSRLHTLLQQHGLLACPRSVPDSWPARPIRPSGLHVGGRYLPGLRPTYLCRVRRLKARYRWPFLVGIGEVPFRSCSACALKGFLHMTKVRRSAD